MAQVGSGEVAIVPVFKGFRRAVSSEVDGSAKAASSGFTAAFTKTGTESGKGAGTGFKKAFESAADGASSKATKQLEQDVAKAARAVSTARLKEQDAAGKVRVAERQLAEAREKYAADSSQVVRAQERLESATRNLNAANERTEDSTNDLRSAQKRLADAADDVGDEFEEAGRESGGRFTTGFGKFIGGVSIGSFIGNFVSNVVSNIGAAIGDGLRAGFDFLKESVGAASDLNESLNAVQVSYGDFAGEIEALAKGAASRLGLSQTDFQGFATQFSSFAQTIRGNDVVGFIDELTTRGADFASVYNLEVSEALQLFQSGLAGETEPLRKFGIDLSAAAVEAYAYASGIAAAGEPLSEAQKQQARYGLLLEQTAKTAGDFQNTSGELANQQRILSAEFANAQAKLGMALLPALTQLANVATTTLIPVLNDVIDKVGPILAQALADTAPMIGDLITQLAPLLPELARMGAELLPLLIEGLIAISPFLIDMAKNFASNWEILNGFLSWLSGDSTFVDFMGTVMGGTGTLVEFGNKVGSTITSVMSWFSSMAHSIGSAVGTAVGFVNGLKTNVMNAVRGAGEWLVNSGKAIIDGFIEGIKSMIGAVGDAVSNVVDWAKSFFPHSPAKRGPLSGAGWRRIAEGGASLIEQFESGFGNGPDVPFGFGGGVPFAPAAAVAGGGGSSLPRTLILRVGDREFTAYVDERADGRIGSYDSARKREARRGERV